MYIHNVRLKTSIYGKRLGLDRQDLCYAKGFRGQYSYNTSDTTGQVIPPYGFNTVVTTTNDGWLLGAPMPGTLCTLMTGSSSTGTHSISLNGYTAMTSGGTAGSTVTLIGGGASLTMVGACTGSTGTPFWNVLANGNSTANAYVTS